MRWKKSTHYARAIAVFKTSLSLCVTHLSSFRWIGGRREPVLWAERKEEEDLISGDLQTLRSPVTFSQAETQEEAGRTLLFFFFFFFSPAPFSTQAFYFELFLTSVRSWSQRTLPLFSLRHACVRTHTHTQKRHIHTHTQALLGY